MIGWFSRPFQDGARGSKVQREESKKNVAGQCTDHRRLSGSGDVERSPALYSVFYLSYPGNGVSVLQGLDSEGVAQ